MRAFISCVLAASLGLGMGYTGAGLGKENHSSKAPAPNLFCQGNAFGGTFSFRHDSAGYHDYVVSGYGLQQIRPRPGGFDMVVTGSRMEVKGPLRAGQDTDVEYVSPTRGDNPLKVSCADASDGKAG